MRRVVMATTLRKWTRETAPATCARSFGMMRSRIAALLLVVAIGCGVLQAQQADSRQSPAALPQSSSADLAMRVQRLEQEVSELKNMIRQLQSNQSTTQ